MKTVLIGLSLAAALGALVVAPDLYSHQLLSAPNKERSGVEFDRQQAQP